MSARLWKKWIGRINIIQDIVLDKKTPNRLYDRIQDQEWAFFMLNRSNKISPVDIKQITVESLKIML